MKFFACIKQVPDLSVPMQIRDGKVEQDNERLMLNAYDASAVEEALTLIEKYGGDLEVVLIGPDKAKETIRKALAMGASQGHHIVMDTDGLDSESYASILAAFFKDKEYDVIATGKQSQDTDAGLTGAMLAQKLDLPYGANAVGLDIEDSSMIVTRQGDTGQEILEVPTPCLVTCSNDMNEPRIPSLKGIMKSKKKPMENLTPEDLQVSVDSLKSETVRTEVTEYQPVPEREPGQQFEGEPEELAQKLTDLLQNEAKVL